MKLDIKKSVLVALYTAIFVVLSLFGTINFQSLKITVQNLPVYVAGITLGVFPGALVGFAGMLINQMITYGFTATTLFWVLPQTILGAVCGYIFESKTIKCEDRKKLFVTILFLQLLVTLLNTVVQAIDAIIYGYFNYIVILEPLTIRIMVSIFTGIVYFIVIPI